MILSFILLFGHSTTFLSAVSVACKGNGKCIYWLWLPGRKLHLKMLLTGGVDDCPNARFRVDVLGYDGNQFQPVHMLQVII